MAEKSLDEILAGYDLHQKVFELFQGYGADDRQAECAASTLKSQFEWTGVQLKWKEGGTVAVDDPNCREHYARDYSFLVPATGTAAKLLDTSLEEHQAFEQGSVQARGTLVRKLGAENADTRAKAWGLDSIRDFKTKPIRPDAASISDEHSGTKTPPAVPKGSKNPWSAEAWDPAAQLGIAKRLGPTKAAELAHSAGSFLGAPRPGAVNLTSFRRSA